MSDNFRDAVDVIIDNFDFYKVHKCMVALDWTWGFIGRVPEIPELKQFARKLLMDLLKRSNPYTISSGGFTVRLIDGNLSLTFELEEFDVDIETINN